MGLKTFDRLEILHLLRFVYARLLIHEERLGVLVDLCTRELAQRNVVLPGSTTVERLVIHVREHVSKRLYTKLANRLNKKQIESLEHLLDVGTQDGIRKSPLELLRRPPDRISSTALSKALNRIEAIRDVGVAKVNLEDVPESRLIAISKYAQVAWAQSIAKLSRVRCRATMLVYMQYLEKDATDDALEVFDALMTTLQLRNERKRRVERLRTIADLDASALLLRDALRVVFDEKIVDDHVRKTMFSKVNKDKLLEAMTVVTEITSPAEDVEAEVWSNAVTVVGRFIVKLLSVIEFDGTSNADPLLTAMKWLVRTSGKSRDSWGVIPKNFIPRKWHNLVLNKPNELDSGLEKVSKTPRASDSKTKRKQVQPRETDQLNRSMYAVCIAHQLQQALKRREVFVPRSHKHGDPRTRLLQGEAWESKRNDICRSLGLSKNGGLEVQKQTQELHGAYLQILEQHKLEPCISLESHPKYKGKFLPVVPALEGIPETETYCFLERRLEERLPDIDLSELMLEVNAATGFCDDMVLLSEGQSKIEKSDLALSVCAVLVAQACNIGLHAVAQQHLPALSLGRLAWVQQNYVRADTILKANARLVDYHAQLPLVQHWGGGEVASADGLRFVVPIRNVFSGANSKYFGAQRGITFYSLMSDQYAQLHYTVVPGTLRDSLYLLSLLLEQQTSIEPKEIMTDTAGYSDVVFGLCKLLGFQFSPRIKDLGELRYWRTDAKADYGILNDVSSNKIKTELIVEHWDDILRLVGSLKLNAVKATDIMRVLTPKGSLSQLGKAIAEVGRIQKTKYLLEYISSEVLRRRVHAQLSRGELRNSIAREVYHGHRGEMREKFRDGMENQLGALGFVINAIALWNTRYMQAALSLIQELGDDVLDEDVARLSPLKWKHINFLGRYHFELLEAVAEGDLRPLKDPNTVDPFESILRA